MDLQKNVLIVGSDSSRGEFIRKIAKSNEYKYLEADTFERSEILLNKTEIDLVLVELKDIGYAFKNVDLIDEFFYGRNVYFYSSFKDFIRVENR